MTNGYSKAAVALLLIWILICACNTVAAATYQRWLPPESGSGEQDDRFGSAITATGEWLFVAADYDRVFANGYRTDSAVHVYRRVGGTVQWVQRLRRPNSGEFEYGNLRFGKSLAAADNWVAVGAPGDRSGRGAVYLYMLQGNSWVLAQSLTSDGDSIPSFGYRVALDGETVVASSFSNSADVDVFERAGLTWVYRQRISPVGGGIPQNLDVDGDFMAIGVIGKVGVWRRSAAGTWSFQQDLLGEAQNGYPASTDVDGGRILVGDPDVATSVGRGVAQVFQSGPSGWTRIARLEIPTGLFEGTVNVGAAVAWQSGSAYVSLAPRTGQLQEQRDGVARFVQSGSSWIYHSSAIDGVIDNVHAGTIMTPLSDGGVAMGVPDRFTGAGGNAGRVLVFNGSQQLTSTLDLGVGAFKANRALIEGNFVVVPYDRRFGLPYVFDVLEFFQNTWVYRRRITLPNQALSAPTALCGGLAVARAFQGVLLIDVRRDDGVPQFVTPPATSSGPIECSGDNLVFGNPNTSQAYAFRRVGETWNLVQTIENPDPGSGTFGSSVSVDDDRMIVAKWAQVFAFRWTGSLWESEGSFSCANCAASERAIYRDDDRIAFSNCGGCLSTVRRVGAAWVPEASGSQQTLAYGGLRDNRIISARGAAQELVPNSGGGFDVVRSFVDQDGSPINTTTVAIRNQETVFTLYGPTDPRTDNPEATVILFENPDALLVSGFE
jgi:hypothetical protein